jgi:hypothetical protein
LFCSPCWPRQATGRRGGGGQVSVLLLFKPAAYLDALSGLNVNANEFS